MLIKTLRTSALFIAFLTIVSLATPAFAEIRLHSELLQGGSELRAFVALDSNQASCRISLQAAQKRRPLNRGGSRIISLASVDTTESVVLFQSGDLLRPRLRRPGPSIFFMRAIADCGEQQFKSDINRMRLRERPRRRFKTVRGWINQAVQNMQASELKLSEVYHDQEIDRPLGLASTQALPNQLFLLEQAGTVSRINLADSPATKHEYLNIEHLVYDEDFETGLLGLAFDPLYNENGLLYVFYSTQVNGSLISRISRFEVQESLVGPVNVATETMLLEIPQPSPIHQGGQLAFGPDGYLYISVGDGGPGKDPGQNAQNTMSLLGSVLRIDPNRIASEPAYFVPADNQFVNRPNFLPEIYAYGFRNPWRFSFDPLNGRLWLGDVGQARREEVNLVKKGGNYGWNVMEGTLCFEPAKNCRKRRYEAPILDYGRADGGSITGGYVYRGENIPALNGYYIFGDFLSGRIWALNSNRLKRATKILLFDTHHFISSFGVDDLNNQYFISFFEGKVFSLDSAELELME